MVFNVNQLAGRVQRAMHNRNTNVTRINDGLATVTSVDGVFLTDGAGEAVQTVNFPVRFIERPNFVFGGEHHLDTAGVGGELPMMSCVINSWITDPPILTTAQLHFIGANLLVVTSGPPTQRIWIHWRATGRALTNPVNASVQLM